MKLGVGDIAVYIPKQVIRIADLVRQRADEDPQLARHMSRAVAYTGQAAIRFPEPWEDTATMAAQAAGRLLDRCSPEELASLRYVAVGTETSVDHAKPIAAYVQGMLQRAGYPVPERMSTFQIQHACAGGTISLLGVNALLAQAFPRRERGLVICTDIARYDIRTTAEITQGAGAVAMLAEPAPRLLELDLGGAGYSSQDVDDFFRPLTSETARVKGGYSIKCYKQAMEQAFLDHCQRIGEAPATVLKQADIIAFHTPYRELPVETLRGLVEKHLPATGAAIDDYLSEHQFDASVALTSEVGNLYSGSLYLALVAALAASQREHGDQVVGKSVLLFSYGSGNTAVVVSGRVAPEAVAVMARWNLDSDVNHAQQASFGKYAHWVSDNGHAEEQPVRNIPGATFYLDAIREDGYRVYGYRE